MAKDTVIQGNFRTLDNDKPLTLNEKLSDFLQKRRKTLAFCAIGIVAILVILIAVFSISDMLQSRALAQVEEFTRRYETLLPLITDESKATDVQVLIDELSAFAPKHAGYTGARGYLLLASIYAEQKNWAEAEKAWDAGAKVGAKTYLAPVCLFSAAVAAEEQGNVAEAIERYTQCVAFADTFPAASRAQFSIGRLQEAQGNKDAALAAYREIPSRWPSDTTWASLAQSKIIFLSR
ncbi:MAG: tetratricopeptide repeat protein [Treponema sp.]|jgi:tetratricopeptide (TPR) repeat protein|nr:tetratricopeptide repeat protein [Treponema sp.]